MGLRRWLAGGLAAWLNREARQSDIPPCDFDRLSFEIRPCDVLLVEGRSRVSNIIKKMTLSHWTHSALYIGRLHDIDDPELQRLVQDHYEGEPTDQLIIEPLLGEGTVINPLSKYKGDHLRICRPKGLSRQDIRQVIKAAVSHIGVEYNVRQLFDMARFILPYGILPRRWRSTLFRYHPGEQTKTICSTLIAEVFAEVHYPVVPVVHREEDGNLRLYKRNTRLYTPSDFDYSPYFEIIKFPVLGFDDLAVYRQLPWDKEGIICNERGDCFVPGSNVTFKAKKIKKKNVIEIKKLESDVEKTEKRAGAGQDVTQQQ